jgi:hypothetical protein
LRDVLDGPIILLVPITDTQFFTDFLIVVFVLVVSVGTDFWWGYHETHTVEGGVGRVIFGFIVLGMLVVVKMFRGKL